MGGGREGYAGRGRVMHIDVDVHEFFILSYDFESRSVARKARHLVASWEEVTDVQHSIPRIM